EGPEPDEPVGRRAGVLVEPDLGPDHRRLRVHGLPGRRGPTCVLDPPQRERVDDRLEIAAGIREPIPDLAADLRRFAGHDTRGLELAKTARQPGGGDLVETPDQIGEAPRPELQVSHDEQRPPLADYLKGPGGHAEMPVDAIGVHREPTPRYRCDSTA